ncbi:MAG: hypothetical protein EBT34_03945, partial [Acetobacteraceae bacterium]|nr:hypothetical protein [Acetobacteraceae bacterium]
MLEMPATLPPKPAAGPAPGAAPMQAGNESTDFRAQLREALETPGAAPALHESSDASMHKSSDQTPTADEAVMAAEAKSGEALANPAMGLGNSEKADSGALPIWNGINFAPSPEAKQEAAGITLQNASMLAPEAAVVLAGAGSGPSLTVLQTTASSGGLAPADSVIATGTTIQNMPGSGLQGETPPTTPVPGQQAAAPFGVATTQNTQLQQGKIVTQESTGNGPALTPRQTSASGAQGETPPIAPVPDQQAAVPFGVPATQLAQIQQGKIVTQEADAAAIAANAAAQQMAAPAIQNGPANNILARKISVPQVDGSAETAKASAAAALLERALGATGVAAEITALVAAEPKEAPWRPAMQEAPQAAAPRPAAEARADTLSFQAHAAL